MTKAEILMTDVGLEDGVWNGGGPFPSICVNSRLCVYSCETLEPNNDCEALFTETSLFFLKNV